MKLALAASAMAVVVGALGLARGETAVPTTSTSQSQPSSSADRSDSNAITIFGAYVTAPVPPNTNAAAYFTVRNDAGTADRLISVASGAGAEAVMHVYTPAGSMKQMSSLTVPAHGSLQLASGKAHVEIEKVTGHLAAGQTVSLELDFANAGSIDVDAPVVGLAQPKPSAS